MRSDLLTNLAEERDITNAIVLTHNIDFVFLQTVVLSALRRCGYPSLTVFADAGCAASAYASQASVLHNLGVRYRVVPIEVEPGFRFHPKALLLSGVEYAVLHVGSGNLTFGGWRENAEVWLRFDTRTDGTGAFAAFRSYLDSVMRRVALRGECGADVEEAFDPRTRTWATTLEEPGDLLGRIGSESALLDQMLERIGDARINRVTVCAPYFDEAGEALTTLAQRVSPAPVSVLVQPGRTGLTKSAWDRVGSGPELSSVIFRRTDEKGHTRESFVHAKFYAFEHPDAVTLFLGSANCSRAALTIPGRAGNAELLAMRIADPDTFRSFIAELVNDGAPPTFAPEVPEVDTFAPALRILGASYESGQVRVAYAPGAWRISECRVDDVAVAFEPHGAGLIRAHAGGRPRQVILAGGDGTDTVHSAPSRVDHEWELRSTARARSVSAAVNAKVRGDSWGDGAWAEVLSAFCLHLQYLPARPAAPHNSEKGDSKPVVFTAKDVFAAGYALPALSPFLPTAAVSPDERVRSLQQLFLRWFGSSPATETPEPVVSELSQPPGEEDDEGGVDVPEQFPTTPFPPTPPKRTDRDRRRAERLAEQLCRSMTNAEFLEGRSADLLAADLRIASVLLIVAVREGWLDLADFFRVTQRIWSALFFSVDKGASQLQRRYESAVSPKDFAEALRSPDTVAALAAWALSVQPERTPEHARFALTAALAVARLPWLWDGIDDHDVCRELAGLVARTVPIQALDAEVLETIGERWLRLMRQGYALRRLESAVAGVTPAQLSSRVQQAQLSAGELLWQGSAGFCVVKVTVPRTAGKNVKVLRLNDPENKKPFSAPLTVPMSALLDDRVVPTSDPFGPGPRRVLAEFLAELANGFNGGPAQSTPNRQIPSA